MGQRQFQFRVDGRYSSYPKRGIPYSLALGLNIALAGQPFASNRLQEDDRNFQDHPPPRKNAHPCVMFLQEETSMILYLPTVSASN